MRLRTWLRKEVTVETHRLVLALPGGRGMPECTQCGPGTPMVTQAVAAVLAGVTVAAIHRAVADGTLHHRRTDGGELLVCLGAVSRG